MKLLFRYILFLYSTFSVAQSSLIEQLHAMQVNPILKEKVFVHTNKTTYFPDDVIWFKAYVGDSINYPSLRTKVLEVKLFDDNGLQVFNRTVAITTGTGNGQIPLNDAVAPGTYYLQARTNYMRNFGEDYQYLQKIRVLGQEPLQTKNNNRFKYDVQLLPEGGNLIEDVENVLGIKAMLNGRSIEFNGIIVNKKGDTVTSFKSEHEGLSRCKFAYKKGETYRAQIKVNDTLLEQDVPNALAIGVSLSVDTSDDDYLKVSLKTNEATFYNQVYSNYRLLYHQDRQLFEMVSVARLDSLTGLIETKKAIFLDGVHTVTLFADDQPIAQRKFYIETERKKTLVSIEKSEVGKDSITYSLTTKGNNNKNLKVDISVSVLKKNSEVAAMKNTIITDFLLTPYLKGFVENPNYYFNNKNRKRKEHLDLLLLTQGWTRYSLKEMIEEINPTEKYNFETGFILKGNIKEDSKHKNLVLIPNNLRVVNKVALEGKSDFAFQNLTIFKGDTVRVAYQNWLGKISKPSEIAYDTMPLNKVSYLSIPKALQISKENKNTDSIFDSIKNYGAIARNDSAQLRNIDGTIDLEEVTVTERKRSEQYLARRKVIEKYEPIVSDIGKYYDLPFPKISEKYGMRLVDFIAQQGFRPKTIDNVRYILLDDKAMGPGRAPKVAIVFVNGRIMAPEELTSVQLTVKDIENVMANNVSKDLTIFQVFTKDAYGEDTPVLFDKFIIKDGFDRPKQYYTPLYAFGHSRPENLLEIDWKPNLKTNKKGEASFKIATDEKGSGLLFSIQGFSNDGHLISKTIVMD